VRRDRLYTDARVARTYAGTSEVMVLRGHQRGDEGDHRQVARLVTSAPGDRPLGESRATRSRNFLTETLVTAAPTNLLCVH